MHEMAITQAMLNMALEHAQGYRITDIYLQVGRMSLIVPESVELFFDYLSKGSLAEGAALHFETMPLEMTCMDCGRPANLDESPDKLPREIMLQALERGCECGSKNLRVTGGAGFCMVSLAVGEHPEAEKGVKAMKDSTQLFSHLLEQAREVVAGPLEKDKRDEQLQAICKLLKDGVPHYDWVGFYMADESKRELALGPFEGEPTEHVKIPFGQGICGQAAETRKMFVVQDVSQEANYLACSLEVQSEIVVPLFKGQEIVGELDIDSHALAPFTDADREFLDKICQIVSLLF